jgi:hypothetical protein
MFIKVTNTAAEFQGEAIFINVDHITAIYDHAKIKDGSLTTFIHARIGPPITWEVEESATQVMKLIKEATV